MNIKVIAKIEPAGDFPVVDTANVASGNERLDAILNNKVDKETGKMLSSNDYTSADKAKLDGVETHANNYVHPTASGYKHIPSGGSSGQVLGWSADGTAQWVDAQGGAEYSDATEETHGLMSATDKTKLDGIATGATNVIVDGTLSGTSTNAIQNKAVYDALDGKVDKISGKVLSSNDYTNSEKAKLAGIATGATNVIVDNALSGSSTNAIQNKAVYNALTNKADSSVVTTINNRLSVNESNIAAQTTRIDAITALAEGSTTGDAELQDIRTEYTGNPATNAGTAVREQIEGLMTSIDKKTGVELASTTLSINRNAIHKVENGKHAVYYGGNYSSYRSSIFTPPVGRTYRYSGVADTYANQYNIICYNGDSDVFYAAIGGPSHIAGTISGFEFTVPEGTTALAVTSYGSDPVLEIVNSGVDRNTAAISDLSNDLESVEDLIEELGLKTGSWKSSAVSSESWRSTGRQLTYDAGYQFEVDAKNVPSGLTIYAEFHSSYDINSGTLISNAATINKDGVYMLTVPDYSGNLYLMYKTYTASALNITLNILDSIQADQYTKIKSVDTKIGEHKISDTIAFQNDETKNEELLRVTVKNGEDYYVRLNTDSDQPLSDRGIQFLENGYYKTAFENGDYNRWVKLTATRNISKLGLYITDSSVLIKKPTYITMEFANKVTGESLMHEQQIAKINTKYGLNHYYYENDWIQATVKNINEQTAVLEGVSFMFFTDLHYNHNEMQSQHLAKYILDHSSIPFILCGGDFTAAYGPDSRCDSAINYLIEYQATIGKDRMFSIRGNHDFTVKESAESSNGYTCDKATTVNAITKKNEFYNVESVAGEMYYTIDIPSQKTRILMMNSCDSETAGAVAWGVHYSVSAKQLTWMLEKLTEKQGWNYIVVSHVSADPSVSDYDVSQLEIHNICKAVNNHGTYGSYDFTNTTNEIVCHIVGHNHRDESHVLDNVLTISMTSDANYTDGGHYRGSGTVYEQAIDVFTINYENRTISAYRVGGGNNRSWNY